MQYKLHYSTTEAENKTAHNRCGIILTVLVKRTQ